MRWTIIAPFLVLLLPPSAFAAAASSDSAASSHRIVPAASYESYSESSSSVLTLRPDDFSVDIDGDGSSPPPSPDVRSVLASASDRLIASLFVIPDFPGDRSYVPPAPDVERIPLRRLSVTVTSGNDANLYHGVDESYDLTESSLSCRTVWGCLRGLETYGQLVEYGWEEEDAKTSPPRYVFVIRGAPLAITDAPAYPYRGLLIDTSRHYLPLDLILANLDAMAMNKLNVLHWHVTDTQSFPFRSDAYPELADEGAYSPERVYTPDDVRRVVHEAYVRGVRVVPEFDMPGHTGAMAVSHPEIMSSCPNPQEPLDPTKEETYELVEGLYGEMATLFPDEFVHVGGDEVSMDCWGRSKSIREWMRDHNVTDVAELFDYFEGRLLDLVGGKLGKKTVVWQEVFNLGLNIRNDTLVDVWKGYDTDTILNATSRGFRVIVSGCWYLDHLSLTWGDFYRCDPRSFNGTEAQKSLVVGGHASMWGESVDSSDFTSRVWPRATSAAERLWTGKAEEDLSRFRERLYRFRCWMVGRGVGAGPVGPGVCPNEPRYRGSGDGWGGGAAPNLRGASTADGGGRAGGGVRSG